MGVLRQAIDNITVLRVSGGLFGGDLAQELRQAIKDEAALGNTRLVLDMSGCNYVNSIGVAEIIEGRILYAASGGEVKLCGLQKRVARAFEITRVISMFAIYTTVDETIAAFNVSPA